MAQILGEIGSVEIQASGNERNVSRTAPANNNRFLPIDNLIQHACQILAQTGVCGFSSHFLHRTAILRNGSGIPHNLSIRVPYEITPAQPFEIQHPGPRIHVTFRIFKPAIPPDLPATRSKPANQKLQLPIAGDLE